MTKTGVDRFDRRKLLVLTQTLSMIQALLMAILTLTGLVQVWHIMVLSLLIGLINALDNPTRQSFYPSLVSCFRHFLGIKSYCVYSQRLR